MSLNNLSCKLVGFAGSKRYITDRGFGRIKEEPFIPTLPTVDIDLLREIRKNLSTKKCIKDALCEHYASSEAPYAEYKVTSNGSHRQDTIKLTFGLPINPANIKENSIVGFTLKKQVTNESAGDKYLEHILSAEDLANTSAGKLMIEILDRLALIKK